MSKKYPYLLEYTTSKLGGVESENHFLHVKDEEEAIKLLDLIKISCWRYENRNVDSASLTSPDETRKELKV